MLFRFDQLALDIDKAPYSPIEFYANNNMT